MHPPNLIYLLLIKIDIQKIIKEKNLLKNMYRDDWLAQSAQSDVQTNNIIKYANSAIITRWYTFRT